MWPGPQADRPSPPSDRRNYKGFGVGQRPRLEVSVDSVGKKVGIAILDFDPLIANLKISYENLQSEELSVRRGAEDHPTDTVAAADQTPHMWIIFGIGVPCCA